VDDILVTESDEEEKIRSRTQLASEFEMKELGRLTSLGLKWHSPTRDIYIPT